MGRRTHGTKRYKMQNSQERRPWIRPPPDHHDTQPKTRNKHTDSYIQLRQDGLEQDEGQAGRIPPKNNHREHPTNTDIGRSTGKGHNRGHKESNPMLNPTEGNMPIQQKMVERRSDGKTKRSK